jgi:hypothetical protein
MFEGPMPDHSPRHLAITARFACEQDALTQLAEACEPDERTYLQDCAKDSSDALQFAWNGWWYRHETDRPWTPAMTEYQKALLALRSSDQGGIDCDAAFPRGNSGYLGRKTR